MAKGRNGEGIPAGKGKKDPLLAELNEVLSAPAKPIIPPELSTIFPIVPPKVLEKYSKITDPIERERLVKNLQISQQTQAERENTQRKVRKSAAPRTEKSGKRREPKRKPQQSAPHPPAGLAPELLHAVEKSEADKRAEIATDIARWNAMNQTAGTEPVAVPSADAEPTAPSPESEADRLVNKANEAILTRDDEARNAKEKFEERIAEVAEMLKGHNLGDEDPVADARMFMDFGREEQAFEILEETARKVADGTYAVGTHPKQEIESKVFRSNRKNIHNVEVVPDLLFTPAQMAKIDWIKTQLHELDGKAAIRELTTDEFADRANLELELQDFYEDTPRRVLNKDATPGEGRNMLRNLVEKLTKVTGTAKEKFDWYKSSKEGLIRRNAELDTQLETIGGKLRIERSFRWIGEKYNKMPLKYKLALGATLGLGTVLSAGTLAVAFPLLGIAAQRSAGLATMYMKFEKKSHDEKWGKNVEWGKQKAMLKAGIYTVLLGLTMKEAIEYASGTDLAHAAQAKVEGFLGWMMGHTALQPAASVPEPPTPLAQPPAPEVQVAEPPSAPVAEPAEPASPAPQPAAAAAAVAAAESPPAVSEISVEATRGKGYEYMAKRLWEQLQDKNLDAGQYVDGSDARRLLEADPSSINKVVHDIAAERGIYKPDGTSIQINLGDKLSFDAQGNLKVSNGQTFVNAPEGAPVTPLYPPEPVPVRPPPQELRDFLDKRFAPEPEVYEKVDLAPETIPETQLEPAEPIAETVESVPAAEAPEQAPAEIPNSKDLIARLGTAQSPAETRSILDTLFSSHNVSPDTVAAAIKAAPSMNADPSLVNYIEPNTGAIPGPAVFLGQDGGLTVYGAASVGDTYTIQRTVAERFAALSGQSVKVLLPNGAKGYELVHPDGLVSVETPFFLNFSYKPPLPVTQSVYVFPR